MNITELSTKTDIDVRSLRYVIEYEILPPMEGLMPGRGLPREFDPYIGFLVALAAYMRGMGLRRGLVKQVMETVLEYRKPGFEPGSIIVPVIYTAFGFAKRSELQIGDASNVRIVSDPPHLKTGKRTVQTMSMPWTQMETQEKIADGYEPSGTISVRIDLLAGRVGYK